MAACDNAKPAVPANEFLCCFQLRQPSGGPSTTPRPESLAILKRWLRRLLGGSGVRISAAQGRRA